MPADEIITNDLIVLPNLSNISLANNGVHISIGSRLLGNEFLLEHGMLDAVVHRRQLKAYISRALEFMDQSERQSSFVGRQASA